MGKIGLKKDVTVTLRDGISMRLSNLYWGFVNIKYLKGNYYTADGKLCLSLPSYPLKLFLTSLEDLYIVGEVLGDEVYRPMVNTTLKNRIVVDVGSFIGISPIYFALQGAKVLAYEVLPVHYYFSLLNLRANSLMDRVIVHNAGIGGINRRITVPLKYHNYSYSIYKSTSKNDDFKHIDVITIDDIIERNDIDKIHLLKMDCEGCEYEIFESINANTLQKINELIMEFHGSEVPIMEKLRKNGFCAVKLKATIRAYNKYFRE
jgi:FkbM family methyltransferase